MSTNKKDAIDSLNEAPTSLDLAERIAGLYGTTDPYSAQGKALNRRMSKALGFRTSGSVYGMLRVGQMPIDVRDLIRDTWVSRHPHELETIARAPDPEARAISLVDLPADERPSFARRRPVAERPNRQTPPTAQKTPGQVDRFEVAPLAIHPQQQLMQRILEIARTKQTIRTPDIMSAIGVTKSMAVTGLNLLVTHGALVRSGAARATRYRLVTTASPAPTASAPKPAGIVRVAGWELVQPQGAPEPLVRDLDLAERLGYPRERSIRVLISRMIEDGRLKEVRIAAMQTSSTGGRPGVEYLLTEAQALKVIAKSETDAADKILDEVISVYTAWRHGKLAAPAAPLPVVSVSLDAVKRHLEGPATDSSWRDLAIGLAKMVQKLGEERAP